MRDEGQMAESQLSELRNMRVLLEEARMLARNLAHHRDTGHAVAFERPEWVVRDLEEFLKGTTPAA